MEITIINKKESLTQRILFHNDQDFVLISQVIPELKFL